MPNLTIKGLGEPLLDRLRSAAARNRRSLNAEVIHRLDASVGAVPVEPTEFLVEARAIRERSPLPYLTDAAEAVLARDAEWSAPLLRVSSWSASGPVRPFRHGVRRQR